MLILDSSFSWFQGNRSFRYKVVSIQVVSIQAVKLHKNFDHFKYSLRVNKEKILGQYSSFFKPWSSWKFIEIRLIQVWLLSSLGGRYTVEIVL